jgi:hypothetical protein
MEFKDFKIGSAFYTDTGKWICVDKGSRTIIAHPFKKGSYNKTIWDLQDNIVFYPYDWSGCHKRKTWKESDLDRAPGYAKAMISLAEAKKIIKPD